MSAMRQAVATGIAVLAVMMITGCGRSAAPPAATSNSAEAATKPAGPPQIVSGKTAFWAMYTAAHSWASDAQVLRVTAKELPGFKNEDGKAAMWEAVFASPSRAKYRVLTYSIADASPNIFKGVDAGLEMPWGGATREAMPVDLSLFNTDSDIAYSAASADAAVWLKKNPGKQLALLEAGDTYRYPDPVWYFMWGTKQAGYAVYVDADSGKVLKHP